MISKFVETGDFEYDKVTIVQDTSYRSSYKRLKSFVVIFNEYENTFSSCNYYDASSFMSNTDGYINYTAIENMSTYLNSNHNEGRLVGKNYLGINYKIDNPILDLEKYKSILLETFSNLKDMFLNTVISANTNNIETRKINLEDKIQRNKSQMEEYLRLYKERVAEFNSNSIMYKGIKDSNGETIPENFIEDLEKVLSSNVRIKEWNLTDVLEFTTSHILVQDDRTETWHKLEPITVTVDPMDGNVVRAINFSFASRNQNKNISCPAPHIMPEGQACFGSTTSSYMYEYFVKSDYPSLIEYIILFLESVNTADSAGELVKNYPVATQEEVEEYFNLN